MGAREDAKKPIWKMAVETAPNSGAGYVKFNLARDYSGQPNRNYSCYNTSDVSLADWLDNAIMYGAKYANERAKERKTNIMDNKFEYGQEVVRGYKAFNADWTCMNKQYTCPGIFHEDGPISVCSHGMHFCEDLPSVFSFYKYTPKVHVCEVIGMGQVEWSSDGRKCCCTDLVVVRELTHDEIIANTNLFADNKGVNNTGQENTGNWNAGNRNEGDRNTGDKNVGLGNAGNFNYGPGNTGDSNYGGYNTGSYNTGDYNTGSRNNGRGNTGRFNVGSGNTGDHNIGNRNAGSFNVGDFHVGWFNTEKEPLYLFNKPAPDLDTEKRDVLQVFARSIERCDPPQRQYWWDELCSIQNEVVSLPNFDPEIFKACTGIDARKAVLYVARCVQVTKEVIDDGVSYIATMKFPDGHTADMRVDGYTLTDIPDADILGREHECLCYKTDRKEINVWVK